MLCLVIAGGLLTACGEQAPEGNEGTEAQENQTEELASVQKDLHFGIVEWPGVTVKTEVAKEILEELGYNVEIESYTQPILLKGLSTGDIDVFMGAWFQSLKAMLQPYLDDGSIVVMGNNLEQCIYRPAVPTYVHEAGVKSIADLNKYADKFDSKYYGIEPGNDGNRIMIDAVNNNTYNLEGWKVVESSTTAMLSQVGNAVQDNEWIVFSAWSPHWMNLSYDIKYLEDPEGIWGEDGKVGTIAKKTLPQDDPNVSKFLKQFVIDSSYQDKWIMEYSKNERPAEEVAQEWVANNVDAITPWLEGVKTVEGKDAQEVFQNAYK